ncbi:MAG: hypothetical protein U0271_18115 [Polyangiaceae bacterium]
MTEAPDPSADQRARHVAWARGFLRSDAAKAELRKNLEAGTQHLLSTKVEALFDAAAIDRLVEHFATDPTLSDTVRPLVRTRIILEAARLREEPQPLGVFVPEDARKLIEELLERPGLMPEKFVKTLLGHRAFEEISRDVLERALTEFSEKVDPFRAEWGLPSLLKLGGPLSFGLGAFAKGLDTVRNEFDKRIEPERKRFLRAFARRALDMVADFVVKRSDEPEFLALRKELFAWVLEQPVSELMASTSAETTELGERIGHAIARHVGALEATKRRRRAGIELLLKAHAKDTVAEALAKYGAKIAPDYDALTEVLWPIVRAALDAPAIDAFVERLVGGFYDERG